jgi:hypothetical protein
VGGVMEGGMGRGEPLAIFRSGLPDEFAGEII